MLPSAVRDIRGATGQRSGFPTRQHVETIEVEHDGDGHAIVGAEILRRPIEILSSEIRRTMKLLGVSTLDELEPGHVTQLARLVPLAQPAADAVASAPARTAPAHKPAAAKTVTAEATVTS